MCELEAPTISKCPSAGRSKSSTTHRRKRIGPKSNKPCGPVPRKHCPSKKRKTDNAVIAPRATREDGSSGGSRPTASAETARATGSRWRTSTPTTPPTAGTSARRKTSCASASTKSATSPWVWRWRASRAGVYPYQKVIIDDKHGEIVGFWKQIVNKTDGTTGGDLRHRRQLVPAQRRRQDRVAARLLRLRPRPAYMFGS